MTVRTGFRQEQCYTHHHHHHHHHEHNQRLGLKTCSSLLHLLLWRFGPFSGHGLSSLLPLPRLQLRFQNKSKFYRVGLLATRPTPILEGQCIPFVWVITFDLPVMGAPASSYATAGIALRILWPRKPRHYVGEGGGHCYIKVLIYWKLKRTFFYEKTWCTAVKCV
jgi:hypothetical protein